MSIETLTGDDFAGLTPEEHEEALDLYDQAISKAAQELVAVEVNYDEFAADRDKLSRLLTLRKVHQVRLDEMSLAPKSAMQQYEENERQSLAA